MIPGTTVSIEDKSAPKPQPRYPNTPKDENGHILLFPFVVNQGPTIDPSKGKDDKSG